ncbi:MAG: aldehyde ferredoxin oxidoreductase C-terminal domain-containing protein [Thermodesulfobacteriota bacterium]
MDLPHLAELYSAATGWDTSVEDLTQLTMKQVRLEKVCTLRHANFDRKDDLPAARDLCEPIPQGALAGGKMDEAKYNRMLDEYDDLHGWVRETGFPQAGNPD